MNDSDVTERHAGSPLIEIRLLGSVRATTFIGQPINIGGPMPRLALVQLALRVGEAVSTDTLVDSLWGENPPPTARRSLQAHVAKLRAALGADDGPLSSTALGYVLDLPRRNVDVLRIEDQLRSAGEVMSTNPSHAAELVASCREDWVGEPMADLADQETLVAERDRLLRLRDELDELEAELQVASGTSATAVPQLERAVVDDPTHEPNWVRLITAYYTSGRQRDALDAYQRASRTLLEELGVDPSPQLQQLELQILRQEIPVADNTESCPYKGLVSYQIGDGDRFYGRSDTTDEIVRLVLSAPVAIVVGPSGVGKSSVLRAGLAHRILTGQVPGLSTVAVITPGPQPLRSLYAAESAIDLLVVDQFEELFTLTDEVHRRNEFVDELLALVQSNRTRVVVSVRADFYGDCLSLAGLSQILGRHQVNVGSMSKVGLREAVLGPAAHVGLEIEPALLDVVVSEVSDRPGALPLLSHALSETWRGRSSSTLTLAGYQEAGSIAGAISATAERLHGALDNEGRLQLERLFDRLVEPGSGTSHTRRVVPLEELDGAGFDGELIDRLVAARLLTATTDRVEIAHEALISAWPRLAEWIDGERDNIVAHQRLTRAVNSWLESDKDEADFYRGNKLEAALTWQRDAQPVLSQNETEFLRVAEQHSRDELTRQRRSNRRLKILAGVSVMAMIAALGASVVAVARGRDADRRSVQVEVNQLVALVAADESFSHADRLRIAPGLHARSSSPVTKAFLLETILESPEVTEVSRVGIIAITGDAPLHSSGGALMVANRNARSAVVNGETLDFDIQRIPVAPILVRQVGDRLLGLQRDSYEVVDLRSQVPLGPAPTLVSDPSSAALSEDGLVLAIGFGADGLDAIETPAHIDILDVGSGSLIRRIDTNGAIAVGDLEFGAEGSRLSAVVDRHTLVVWDVFTGEQEFETVFSIGLTSEVRTTAFNASGDAIVLGRLDGTVELFRADHEFVSTVDGGEVKINTDRDDDWRLVSTARLHDALVTWVEFDAVGAKIASSALDGSVVLWDAITGSVLVGPVEFDTVGQVTSFFDADTGDVITLDSDGTIQRWPPQSNGGLVTTIDVASGGPPSPETREWAGMANGAAYLVTDSGLRALGFEAGVLDVVNGIPGDLAVVYADRIEWRRDGDLVANIPLRGSELAGRVTLSSQRIAFYDPDQDRVIVMSDDGATIAEISILRTLDDVTRVDLNSSGNDLVYSTKRGDLVWYSLDSFDAAQLLHAPHGRDGHFLSDDVVIAVGDDGVQRVSIDSEEPPVVGAYGEDAFGVALDPVRGIAAVWDRGGDVSIWNIATRQQIGPSFSALEGQRPQWLDFAADGQLVVGGAFRTAVLSVEPDVWSARACALVAATDPLGNMPSDPRLKDLTSCL